MKFSQLLYSEWDKELNSRNLDDFNVGSHTLAWWKDSLGHSWKAEIRYRAKGSLCPFCNNQKVLQGFNDLETLYPSVAAQWHFGKNADKTPKDYLPGSNQKVWWTCDKDHEYTSKICDKTKFQAECIYCSGQKLLSGFNDLQSTHPELVPEWHPTKNGNLKPLAVRFGSHKAVWWQDILGHEWKAAIGSRASSGKRGCPYCARTRVLSGFNDLTVTHPNVANQWNWSRNGTLNPNMFLSGSSKKVWWLGKCGHEWEATIVGRAELGHGCIYCSSSKSLAGFNDFQTFYPVLAAEWHPRKNDALLPSQILKSSSIKVWWLGECGHEWDMAPADRSVTPGCPICSSHRLLAGFNDLKTFAPNVAEQLHPTLNSFSSSEVFPHTNKAAWWICKLGHVWKTPIRKRVGKNASNCPSCRARTSKPEDKLRDLIEMFGLDVIRSDRGILNGKEIDIYIPEKGIGIEFNGLYWHSEKASKDPLQHHSKYLAAQAAGVTLLQVWEDDWRDKPEIVIAWLAERLGVEKQLKYINLQSFIDKPFEITAIIIESLTATEISALEAKNFYSENSLQHLDTSALQTYALLSPSGLICAAISIEKKFDDVIEIQTFKTANGIYNASLGQNESLPALILTKLLDSILRELNIYKVTAKLDNCLGEENLFMKSGFLKVTVLDADYEYLVGKNRIAKSDYDEDRFKSDSKLEFKQGLSPKELVDLNKLNKIWNAGYTVYHRDLGNLPC